MATHQTTIVGRDHLTKQMAKALNVSQKQAAAALEATLSSIREALHEGHEVLLVDFGSFTVRTSAARTAVNPRDRTKKIQVPAKERVRFTPGKGLAEAVLKK